jgi:hypothetical protein
VKPIPETVNALVLRTDFSSPVSWESIVAAIREPVGEFQAYVDVVSDPAYSDITVEQVRSLIPKSSNRTFMFIVDRFALSHADRPILVLDVHTEPGRTFRVTPAHMWSVENNLSLANMDFEEFADATDGEGIFRGFPDG